MMRVASLLIIGSAVMLSGCNPPAQSGTQAEATPTAATNLTPAQQAYQQANERMHAGMSAAIAADPDVAFAQGMIPHHQGAIDMARVQLRYGTDPEMRALAQEVIAAQEAEIAQLNAFLARRGQATPAAPAMPQATSTAPPIMDHGAMGH